MSHIGRGASGVNRIALAEAVLFPGLPARALTHPQIAEAARLAKAQLIAEGQWPDSNAERQQRTRASERAERSRTASATPAAEQHEHTSRGASR